MPTEHAPTIQLLSTEQMATFVATGVLEFPAIIDDQVNAQAIDELKAILGTWGTPERPNAPTSGQPFGELYPAPSAIGSVIRHPIVAGALQSLVGPDPRFDHDFVHLRVAGDLSQQPLHADGIADVTTSFDVQAFYFPHDVEPGAGGTGFVPGTHLRRVHQADVARYRHMAGERTWSGPAGSVLIFHHGLWHRGMPNRSEHHRLMYKIRFNPTVPQVRRWDVSDLDDVQSTPDDHIFARFDPSRTAAWLRHREPWMSEGEHRLELVARTRLWRHLTGDESFDIDWYRTRIEGRLALDDAR